MTETFLVAIVEGLMQSWHIWLILLIAAALSTPLLKGLLGEFMVNKAIDFHLDKNIYHTLKNVTLKTDNGTTQIDHIIVSIYGIFVIETKNMKGWIYGGEHQKIWTQKIFRHTSKFQNPLHQNYKHVKAVSEVLNMAEEKIHSVVVFAGSSTFKTKMPDNVSSKGGFLNYIATKKEPLFTSSEVQEIIEVLYEKKLANSFKTHRNHVRDLKNRNNNATAQTNTDCCPKCGSALVLRTAKKGSNAGSQFYGCSSFPRCRYMKKINL